jgi:hypothetical protein
MRDTSPQHSPIVFPAALEPAWQDDDHEAVAAPENPWGWLELFVLVQVLWGALLFVPGSQGYRIYIRAFPYVASLVALVVCSRVTGADSRVPGTRWVMAALATLVIALLHPATWLTAGAAQVVFQLSIAAPVFWAARVWMTRGRFERLLKLVFGANLISAGLGLLQVYYPATFMPPEFSQLALRMNAGVVGALTYIGADGREIIRPPGLSDLPGGAAIAGTVTALLGFGLAMHEHDSRVRRYFYLATAVVGITVVYLTQVRSMLVMICLCMLALSAVRLRQGRIMESGWIAGSAAALVGAAFIWAVTVGGESVSDRFSSILDTGLARSYQENRGIFLSYTVQELLWEYPFGAGVGRWGMMSAYFGEPENWKVPALWAEIQPTGWLYDGGIVLWLFYGGAIFISALYTFRVASDGEGELSDLATMVFSIQMLVVGLCLTGPVFNTQMGIMYWLLTAGVYGAERTALIEAELAAEQPLEEDPGDVGDE